MSPGGSRRSSIDSNPRSPFASPFDDSRPNTRPGSPTESLNTQTVQEKFNITPSAGLILFPEDVEKDDYLHNPDPPGSKGADDYSLWNRRALVNLGGLIFVTIGLLCLFIGYPNIVMTAAPFASHSFPRANS